SGRTRVSFVTRVTAYPASMRVHTSLRASKEPTSASARSAKSRSGRLLNRGVHGPVVAGPAMLLPAGAQLGGRGEAAHEGVGTEERQLHLLRRRTRGEPDRAEHGGPHPGQRTVGQLGRHSPPGADIA